MNKLEEVHKRINKIIREKIDFSMEKLQDLVLFDQQYVCSKKWTTVQFLDDAVLSTRAIGEVLHDNLTAIEKALKVCSIYEIFYSGTHMVRTLV